MLLQPQIKYSGLFLLSLGFAFASTNVLAQDIGSTGGLHPYENGYDDGYDDGYEDAMDDCPCPPQIVRWTGLYVGGELGYESYQARNKVFLDDMHVGTLRSNATGGLANIFAGYGKYIYNNFYLGGEVFLGRRCAESTDRINTLGVWDKIKFSAGTTYGFGVMPGYKLNSGPLMFLHLGYDRTDFTVKESLEGTNLSWSKSNWTNGISYGLGMQTPVYKDFSLRVQYKHIDYSSFTTDTGTKSTPSDNQGSLGLLYNFRF